MATLAAVAFLSFLNWRRFEAASAATDRSREVLDANSALLTTVKDAEAAMRTFVLTDNLDDLRPYELLKQSLVTRQKRLASLVVPQQAGLAAQINQLADERMGYLAIGLQIRHRRGQPAATQYVLNEGGRQKMAELRGLTAQLSVAEYDDQARTAFTAERHAFDAFLVATIGCSFAFIILLLLQRAVDTAIAQRNTAIAELAANRERLEITLASIGDGVIATDASGRVTFLNAVAGQLCGWSYTQATGRPVSEVLRIADENTGQALSSPISTPTLLRTREGGDIAISGSGSPIRTAEGQVVGSVLVFRDIRASREAQKQIEKWHRLFRAGGFGMAVISANDTLLDVNPAFAAMHGYPEEELIGTKFSALLASRLTTSLDGGRVTFESNHRHREGHLFPVLTDLTVFHDAAGRPTERAAYFSDISARINAETLSREAQQRYKTAVDVVSDIIWTNSAQGQMVGEQRAWGLFTGQTLDEYQGYGWSASVHPEDIQPTIVEWEKAVAGRTKFVCEHRLRRHDGVYRHFAVRALPLFDEHGQLREWVGVHADITEEREFRNQLMESEGRLSALASALPQMIWSTRPDGGLEYNNPAWIEYLGQSVGGPVAWGAILHPDDAADVLARWHVATKAAEPFEFTARLKRAGDGVYRSFLCRTVPLLNASGQVLRWFGSCTDIDDQSRRAHELKESNEALRRSNTDLEQFAYAASHDLQEPLRMVALYTQLLSEDYAPRLDETAMSYIDQSLRASRRMETLLQALLQYSMITAATTVDSRAEADDSVRNAIDNLASLIARTGAQITCDPLPGVRVAPVRLTQLFQNLISNALKYRREDVPPQVAIRVAKRSGGKWLFSIADNGIGMDAQYLEQIFGIFKRLHGQEYEGTGIGLAICQRIVENSGGTIWAESTPKKGTTFFFTLPPE